MLVKLSDAAWLVGRHERVVRRRLLIPESDEGHLPAKKDGQVWMIDTKDLAKFWRIDPARLDEMERRQRSTPDVMAAKIAALESEIQALKTRIRTLEALNAHQTRQDDRQAAWEGVEVSSISPPAYRHAGEPVARSFSTDFPESIRKRALWVQAHGGPGESWVRTWADVPSWRGVEDAIASVRSHKNWQDWQPS